MAEEVEEVGEREKVYVVVNPMAASCTPDDVRQAFNTHFETPDRYEIYETTGKENLVEVVQAALKRGFGLIVAAGGDGTVSEVAEALVGQDIPLGIIPIGTANVFARELNLPLTLDAACMLLASPHSITKVDAMKSGDKYFVLQIGIGLDSIMIRDTARAAKRRFGRAAYMWTAFTRLVGYQPVRFTVVIDGKRSRVRALQVLIANGGVLGIPPFRWGPDIHPDDGQIDVCIVNARTGLDYVGLVWHTLTGQQRRDRNVRYAAARQSVLVSADHPMPVQADGEIISETPLQIQVVPHAVGVVVPLPEELASAGPKA